MPRWRTRTARRYVSKVEPTRREHWHNGAPPSQRRAGCVLEPKGRPIQSADPFLRGWRNAARGLQIASSCWALSRHRTSVFSAPSAALASGVEAECVLSLEIARDRSASMTSFGVVSSVTSTPFSRAMRRRFWLANKGTPPRSATWSRALASLVRWRRQVADRRTRLAIDSPRAHLSLPTSAREDLL